MENQPQEEQNTQEAEGALQLTKKERRRLKREEKQSQLKKAQSAKKQKGALIWAAAAILVAGGGFGFYSYLFGESGEVTFDVTSSCVTHAGGGMHIHPELGIAINGERREIPPNIGVSAGCMRPLHTHDATGRLHVEFARQRNFTLGEFFKVWGKPFSSAQILDYAADDARAVSMTVNGEENTDFENLILKDGDRIEIIYGGKSE